MNIALSMSSFLWHPIPLFSTISPDAEVSHVLRRQKRLLSNPIDFHGHRNYPSTGLGSGCFSSINIILIGMDATSFHSSVLSIAISTRNV
jgi:hypothetical protein